MLEEMLLCMKTQSKVILCGATATYAKWKTKSGVANISQAIFKRVTLKGILYFGETEKLAMAMPEMVQLAESQGIEGHETILKGLDQAPIGLQGVYYGKYTGKAIIDLGE
jgi:NADPH-dependent curcumin reductase CurA